MKVKIYEAIRLKLFLALLVLFTWIAVVAFGQEYSSSLQENTLQGTWVAEEGHIVLKFDNGSYEQSMGDIPKQKGAYVVSGNRITMTAMFLHSSFWGIRYSDRLYSQAEALDKFGDRGQNWFAPATHTFSVSGDALHLVGAWGEWRMTRKEFAVKYP